MTGFVEIALILLLAATISIVLTRIKQPAILGYIIAGLAVGILLPEVKAEAEQIEVMAKIGVALLLFTLGLTLDLKQLRQLGTVALATGLGQIVFTFSIGWLLAVALGFTPIAAAYIAIGLTFSSTIVIVKLLGQKRQLDTLHGKISVGFLIVQDFAAILILVVLSVLQASNGGDIGALMLSLGVTLIKGIIVTALIFLVGRIALYPALNTLHNEPELMFITVIAWALTVASIMAAPWLGFSIEIGALLAGVALANRAESLQLESWVKPLRDLFIILFFVMLGLQVNIADFATVLIPGILLSLFVLIGNPLIVMLITSFLGFSSKTGFYTSLSVAQISEFSLIITTLAHEFGYVDTSVLALMTLVGGITMTLSSYMIYYNDALYGKLSRFLRIFDFKDAVSEMKHLSELSVMDDFNADIVMFGFHRMGQRILRTTDAAAKLLIVDIDPYRVAQLTEEGLQAVFGDVGDVRMYEEIGLAKAKIVISTVPGVNDNLTLLGYCSTLAEKPIVVLTASEDWQAEYYYEAGADMVIYPHLLGGDLLRTIILGDVNADQIAAYQHRYIELLLSK